MRSLFRMRARTLAAGIGVLLAGGLTGCWPNPNSRPDLRGANNIPKTNLNSSASSNGTGMTNAGAVRGGANPGAANSAGSNPGAMNWGGANSAGAGSGGANSRTTGAPADGSGRIGMTSGAVSPPSGAAAGSAPYFNQQPPAGSGNGVQPIATSITPIAVKPIQPVANFGPTGGAPLDPPPGNSASLPVRNIAAPPPPISTQNMDQAPRFQRASPAIPSEAVQLPSGAKAQSADPAGPQPLLLPPN